MDTNRMQLFKAVLSRQFQESDVIAKNKTGKTLESFIKRGFARSGVCVSTLWDIEVEVFKTLISDMVKEIKRIAGDKETALNSIDFLEQACRARMPDIRNRMLDPLNNILAGNQSLIKNIDMKMSEINGFLCTELNIARGEWQTGVIPMKKDESTVTYNISGNPQITHGSTNVTQIMHNNDIRNLIPLLDELLGKISTSSLPENKIKDTRETVEKIKEEVQKPTTSLKVIRKLWTTLPEGIKVLDVATRICSIMERIG